MYKVSTSGHDLQQIWHTGKGPNLPTVDGAGNLYLTDSPLAHGQGPSQAWKVPVGTSALEAIAPDVGYANQVVVDRAGRAYVAGRDKVVQISPQGVEKTVSPAGADRLAVTPDGDLNIIRIRPKTTSGRPSLVSITSMPASGAAATTRTVPMLLGLEDVQVAPDGTLYFAEHASTVLGDRWKRLKPGRSTFDVLTDHRSYADAAVGSDGSFYLAQTVRTCQRPYEESAACRAASNVPSVLRFPASGGAAKVIKVEGMAAVSGLAVDDAGNIFAARHLPNDDIAQYRPSGGAPVRVVSSPTLQNVSRIVVR